MSTFSPHRPFGIQLLGLLAVPACLLSLASGTLGWAETWTSLRGDRSVEARMVGMWDGNVVLDLGDRRVTVPMDSLRSDSRIQAEEVWQEIQRKRQSRIDELQGRAKAASAPAPEPLPEPRPAPPYEKPAPNQKVAEYFDDIVTQLEAGHVIVLYDALPPSHQGDVDELAALIATKINPAAWQSFTGMLHQVGDLIVTRQNWLFSNSRWDALPNDKVEEFKSEALKMAGFLREAFDPNEIQLSTLQSTGFGQWLRSRDAVLAPYSVADGKLSEMVDLQVVSETADSAVVNLTLGGFPVGKNMTLTRVEGQWYPAEMAAQWSQIVADAKSQLEAIPNETMLAELSAVAMVQPMLMPLAAASDEAGFHEAMETMIDFARPMVMNMASTAGVNVASNNPRSRRSDGFGSGGFGGGFGGNDGLGEDEMFEDDLYGEEGMNEEDMNEGEMSEADFGGGGEMSDEEREMRKSIGLGG